MGRTPLLLPLIALIGGIIVAHFLPQVIFWSGFGLIAVAVCLWFFRRYAAAVFMLFVVAGYVVSLASRPAAPDFHDYKCEYRGNVRDVEDLSGMRRVLCRIDGVGLTIMRVYGSLPLLVPGDDIEFTALLKPVTEEETVVPDEIRYRTSGAIAECELSSDAVIVTGHHPSVRSRIIDRLLSLPISDEAGSMLCALLVGHTDLITDSRREEFSAAGLSHLLALSGLHVGVISMLISVALWPLYVGRHNRSRRIITIAALWAFAAMTDFSPSVTRSVIMASVYLVGRIIERQSVPMNSLFLAAILILCIWPDSLFEIGFQLSFAAVAGIILFYPLINCVDRREHPWLYLLISYPAVSLAAMVFTGPVSSFYFHSYPLYFLLANLAVSPLVPLLIAAGALAVIFSFAGFQVTWLCSAADWICGAVNGIASFVASLPGHSAVGLYFSPWILCGIIISLMFSALGGWQRRIAPLIIGAGCMVLTAEVHALISPEFPRYEYFVLKDRDAANILVHDADSLYLVSSAPTAALRADAAMRCRARFRDYMERRGLKTLSLLPDTIGSDFIRRRDNLLAIGAARFAILNGGKCPTTSWKIDYLIVAKGFKGDIVKAYREFAPDSAIILSSSLNVRRRERYISELNSAHITPLIY